MAVVPDDDIPQVQQEPLPGRAYPRFDTEVDPAAFGGGIGRALENAGAAIQERHDRARIYDANTQLSAAADQINYKGTDPSQNGEDAAFKQKGENAVNMPDRYLPQLDQRIQEIGSTLTPRQREAFMEHAAGVRDSMALNLNRYEYEEGQRYQASSFKAAGEQVIASGALGWRDPAALDKAEATLGHIAAARADQQGFKADGPDAKEIHDELLGRFHSSVVKQMAAEGEVDKATDYLYGHIDQMTEQQSYAAQNMLLMRERSQEAQDARLLKAGSDQLSKEGDDLLRKGKMTPQWLEGNRDKLDATEYRYFTRQLSGEGETIGSPQVFSDLLVRAFRGEDVSGEARAALLHGQVNKTSYDTIVSKVFAERPGYAKRGIEQISQALEPSQLEPDPAGHQSKASALADFSGWITDHPKATDVQAREEAETLIRHYQIVNQDKTALLSPAPRYLVGTRLQPDLDATSVATMDALNKGELTLAEAQREANLIAMYRARLKSEAADAAARAAQEKAAQ